MEKKEILYLSAAHVQAVLSRKDVIDTVEKVFCQAGEESIVPVSYTHLDVYKRQ